MGSELPLTDFPPGYVETNTGWTTQRVAIAFIILEFSAVAARFGTRYYYKTKWGIDDYLAAPALVFAVGVSVIAIVEVHVAGIGRHLTVLAAYEPQAIVNWYKCAYAIEQLYGAGVAFPKLSIIASYLRVLTDRRSRWIAKIIGVIVALTGTAVVITSLASCKPFSARWDPVLSPTACINPVTYWQASSIPNVFTDIVMLILPLPMVWNLQIDRGQKIALTLVFALGSFGIVASIIRLVTVFQVANLADGTWASAGVAVWSAIEAGVYLISSCLPVLRPLYISVSRKVSSTASHIFSSRSRTTPSIVPFDDDAKRLTIPNKQPVYVRMETWQRDSYVGVDDEEAGNHPPVPNGVSTSINDDRKSHNEYTTRTPVPGKHLAVESRPFNPATDPPAGGLTVKNMYLSLDPWMRGQMRPLDPKATYSIPWVEGEPAIVTALSIVLKSDTPSFKPGNLVLAMTDAGEYARVPPELAAYTRVLPAMPSGIESQTIVGALGAVGMAAYNSFFEYVPDPKAGKTIVVSAAAGGVGQLVGQMAKMQGMRVIGSTGGAEKVKYLLEDLGFDGAWDYKTENTLDALARLAPEGVDVYYDNVGGEQLESILLSMNDYGTVVVSGMISQFNKPPEEVYGVKSLMQVVFKRLKIFGFVCSDQHLLEKYLGSFEEDMVRWLVDGQIKTREHVVEGVENAPDALVQMWRGEKFGKTVVKVLHAE
ncbi:hypothetical protein FHL15_007387 [Xylaria flabelliformis]|uniref:Dehydrogenase FUB6 n=1 Tax=Xylaria flabelliformis TaxID=2512241 RepID=A0A553HV57_9PEZI|nr:hypothetical protein FHL15_007387 [Xylaria flabelliformis]